MYKWVGTELLAPGGRRAEYKAWFEKRNKLLQEAGLGTWTVHQVLGRTYRMVFFESPEFETWEEAMEYTMVQMSAATEGLSQPEGSVLAGSTEWFILTDL